jgi:hypothetical protein
MTYTFKLARRLAVLRDFAMLAVLCLLAACAGETATAPDSVDEAALVHDDALIVSPRTVTAEVNQVIKLRGMMRSSRGDVAATHMTWASVGGRINADGTFSSTTTGSFKVIGRGRGRKQADTSVVIVVPSQPTLQRISLSPDPTSVLAGAQKTFSATGYLSDGTTAPIGVSWTATGGTIDAGGVYTAASTSGAFRVIAVNATAAVADTAAVTVDAPAPAPPPVVAVSLTVAPSATTISAGTTKQFVASARMSDSSVTSPAVTWTATGGTISSTGLYTAGGTAGTYAVKAVSGTLSASASVAVTVPAPPPSGTGGLTFGSYECTGSNLGPFSLCIRAAGSWTQSELSGLKAAGGKLILNQGGYAKFKNASGLYDSSKYYTWVQALKPYVASWQPYLDAGILVGAQVIDDRGKENWGGVAITNAQLDEMAKWWKEIAPGITTFVSGGYATDLVGYSYRYLDGSITQYNAGYMGDVTVWRDKQVAAARSAGTSLILSLNVLAGGKILSGCWNITSGDPAVAGTCSMTASEVRAYGAVLAAAPDICGMASWKSLSTYQSLAGVTDALKYVNELAKARPAVSCKRR